MVSALVLVKTLYCHSASLHSSVQMGAGELNAGVTLRWTSIPFRGELQNS